MKVFIIILIVVAVLFVLVTGAYAYYGGFKTIAFKGEVQGGETLMYEDMTGDYGQTPNVQNQIYQMFLSEEKIETTKGFCIYYDNPKEIEKNRLRSEVGCIVEGLDSTSTVTAKRSEKYQVKILPKNNCIVTEFPYKGKMSIFAGIMKIYPTFEKYCKQNGTNGNPMVEIYDIPNKRIIYRMNK